MVIHKIGDILTQNEAKYICHQVNCKGVMGAGLAKQIRKIISTEQFHSYQLMCMNHGADCLGQIQVFDLPDRRSIINLFGENIPTGKQCDTDYDSLYKSLGTARELAERTGNSMAVPGFLGCGLAGGDWNIVYHDILEKLFRDGNVDLYIFWLNEELFTEGINILERNHEKKR